MHHDNCLLHLGYRALWVLSVGKKFLKFEEALYTLFVHLQKVLKILFALMEEAKRNVYINKLDSC